MVILPLTRLGLPGPQLLRLCGVGDASPGLLGLSGSWAGVNESFPRAPKWLSLLFHALELGCVVRQGHVATVGFQGSEHLSKS